MQKIDFDNDGTRTIILDGDSSQILIITRHGKCHVYENDSIAGVVRNINDDDYVCRLAKGAVAVDFSEENEAYDADSLEYESTDDFCKQLAEISGNRVCYVSLREALGEYDFWGYLLDKEEEQEDLDETHRLMEAGALKDFTVDICINRETGYAFGYSPYFRSLEWERGAYTSLSTEEIKKAIKDKAKKGVKISKIEMLETDGKCPRKYWHVVFDVAKEFLDNPPAEVEWE